MTDVKVVKVSRQGEKSDEMSDVDREEVCSLLETLVKMMVNEPSGIKVSYKVGDKTTIFEIDCGQESIGRLIGSKGRNITALRTIISSIMVMRGVRAVIDIPYYAPNE